MSDVTDAVMELAGERLLLCAERGVYWHTRRMLLVADPHFGKAASFRAAGVPTATMISSARSVVCRLSRSASRAAGSPRLERSVPGVVLT